MVEASLKAAARGSELSHAPPRRATACERFGYGYLPQRLETCAHLIYQEHRLFAFTLTHVEAEIDVARIYWSDQPMALLEETVEVVATGRGITLVPVTVTTGIQVPPEVVAVPVVDAPPTEVCLAWRAGRRSPMIRELVETARTTLASRTTP